MKKFIYSMLAFAISTMALTSCEDVPAPYDNPNQPSVIVTPSTPTGTGTETDPYNVTAALAKIKALAADAQTEEMYVKGKVVSIRSIDTGNFGNAEYYISDDGTTNSQLYIYRSLGLNGQKFTSADAIKVGDEVVVKGIFTNYRGNTPETVTNKSHLYSINGNTANNGTNTTPTGQSGEGTETSPYNVAAMVAHLQSLKADSVVNNLYVKGKVVSVRSIDTSNYGNATYYISDDGTANGQLYIFRSLDLNEQKFTDTNAIKPGDEVVVTGSFTNYKGNTPETVMNKSHLYSIVKGEGHNTNNNENNDNNNNNNPAPANNALAISGTTLTLTNSSVNPGTETLTVNVGDLGLADKANISNVTLSDGTILSFSKDSGVTDPAFNARYKQFRVYANNTLTITGKKAIAKIVITGDQYQTTTYVGNATATVNFDGTKVVYKNVHEGQGGGTQLRILSLTITYAQ